MEITIRLYPDGPLVTVMNDDDGQYLNIEGDVLDCIHLGMAMLDAVNAAVIARKEEKAHAAI